MIKKTVAVVQFNFLSINRCFYFFKLDLLVEQNITFTSQKKQN